jgi:hypothetical protein
MFDAVSDHALLPRGYILGRWTLDKDVGAAEGGKAEKKNQSMNEEVRVHKERTE